MLEGVIITPLKEIYNEKGNILHIIKSNDETFINFGEAYFSEINFGKIKGWKKHTIMFLNLVVPIGEIKFVLFDDRENSKSYGKFWEVIIGRSNFQRLTVPPGIFIAFQGLCTDLNMLINIASIPHDPTESLNKDLSEIPYLW